MNPAGDLRPRAFLYRSLGVLVLVGLLGVGVARLVGRDDTSGADSGPAASQPVSAASADSANSADSSTTSAPGAMAPGATTSAPTTTPPTTTYPLAVADGLRSDERRLVDDFLVDIDGLTPKSVVSSGDGLLFAQNMMYSHNVTVLDRGGEVVAVIPDTLDLAAYGHEGGVVQGSPVEAAFAPDGRHVYVSNYKMYGNGWTPTADDDCNRGRWDDSFVYRIDTSSFEIDQVIRVGPVPKFMAVTPDGRRLLVSNWCGFDVSVVDLATGAELKRIDVGRHPRGIAVTNDSRRAYVTVMGEAKISVIDLGSLAVVGSVPEAGFTPRHLLLSPDGRYLYVSNNHGNQVRKIDLRNGTLAGTAATGKEPRTMAMAEDGESLYVVNYADGTVSKVRTSDMKVLQTIYSGYNPVGIAYDPGTRQVWVANYSGSLRVFVDT